MEYQIDCQDLPSRGTSYPNKQINIKPLDFEQLLNISESDATGDDLLYVIAIKECTDLPEGVFLDVSDFYLVSSIVRLISFDEMPVTMKWNCAERHLKLKLLDSNEKICEMLTAKGFHVSDDIWTKFSVSEKEYTELNTLLDGKAEGSWYTCGTTNTFDLTPDHLMKHVKQLPKEIDLASGFKLPNSIDIPEYKTLGKDLRIAKLLRVCMWLDPKEFGSNLIDRFNYLKSAENSVAMSLIQKALKYDQTYKAGLSKIILSSGCSCCGSATHSSVLSISPKMFFTG
jgi:hypothetical protein